jgi:hypothetical protein
LQIPHHATPFQGQHWLVRAYDAEERVQFRTRTSLCHRLPADFEETLVAFQRHVIGRRKNHSYLLSQIGNADETPVYFDMPPSYTVDDNGAKSVAVKTSGHEKMRVILMLTVLADGHL